MYRDQSTISCGSLFEMYRDLSLPAMLLGSVNEPFCRSKSRKKVPTSNHLTYCLCVLIRQFFYRHDSAPEAPTARKTARTCPSNYLTICHAESFRQIFYRQVFLDSGRHPGSKVAQSPFQRLQESRLSDRLILVSTQLQGFENPSP